MTGPLCTPVGVPTFLMALRGVSVDRRGREVLEDLVLERVP